MRLKRRRDQVAKRPNTSRTDARAGVDGRHLPNGSAEWRQPRFRNFPRGAWRPEEHGPFLGPNPSIQNHRGSEARRSYSAAQLEYYLTYKPLAARKAPQPSWVRAGSPRAGPLGTGPCTRRPLNARNMHSGSPPFFAELVRGTPLLVTLHCLPELCRAGDVVWYRNDLRRREANSTERDRQCSDGRVPLPLRAPRVR